MVRSAPYQRSRRSFRSLYCLVLIISAALLWQSYRSHATGTLQDLPNRKTQIDIPEVHQRADVRLKADYLPWEGIANAKGRSGHRSQFHLNDNDQNIIHHSYAAPLDVPISHPPRILPITPDDKSRLAIPEPQKDYGSNTQTVQNKHANHAVSRKDNQISVKPQDDDQAKGESTEFLAPNVAANNHIPQDYHTSNEQLATPAPETSIARSSYYEFPSWGACQSVEEKADVLPDLVVVPFEDAVGDVSLQGWEDDWISMARYTGPKLDEPKIDFVYNWVNGSQPELMQTMRPYEINSTLNDDAGVWLASHGSNRYREWDELRYSIRSVEKYAGTFMNRIQMLVNAFEQPSNEKTGGVKMGKQRPIWLKDESSIVEVLSQEQFFGPEERNCLPSFDSLTIENQLYNTKSDTDRLFALSDDMILGKPHAASDLYSPLFGPTFGFKDNAYNTLQPPTEKDADRFGEKPFLIYTSWLLNRRFGARKRKGQVHFGHSLSRAVAREAITSFPRPALRSASQRFRGETGFQLYSWYAIFHYTMERHREALLWSYIMLRSDKDDDGYLSWTERKTIIRDLTEGMNNETPELYRRRMYYRVSEHLQEAGLQAPKVNTDILWTSMDGPIMIKEIGCDTFDIDECLAPGFSVASSDARARSPVFASAVVFDRITRETPRCGDCLLKLILNRRRAGLGPVLPHPTKKPQQRETVVKALMKFQYTIVQPDAAFYMVTDAEQADHALIKPYIKHGKKSGQICLNDDVVMQDEHELEALKEVMKQLFEGLLPEPSRFEK